MQKKTGFSVLVIAGLAIMPCFAIDYFTEQFFGDFDLEGLSITFTPDGSVDYYQASASRINTLPITATNHFSLGLSDDSSDQRTFGGDKTFVFYGVTYFGIDIGSNGYLTFTEHDTTYSENLTTHFEFPRISTLFDDLNPAQAGSGSIRVANLDDRYVITFLDVLHFGSTNAFNTFQTELFYNGNIRMSWMEINTSSAIVGLSAGGGQPAGFAETDLSAFLWDWDEDGLPDIWELKYFLNVTNALASADTDMDGFTNIEEFICGTHPKQKSSVFTVTNQPAANGMILRWNAIEGRNYRVLNNTGLMFGSFSPLPGAMAYPQNAYTTTVSAAQSFYKIRVEMSE